MCLGIPGRIESLTEGADELTRAGQVGFGGALCEVNLAYVPEAAVGDYVIVHAGFAISRIDEEEARDILKTLDEMEASLPSAEPSSSTDPMP